VQTIDPTIKGPPEPYTLAEKEMAKPDFDTMMKYFNLTIKDFPDQKEYVYKAHVWKSLFYVSRMASISTCGERISNGTKRGYVFMKSDQIYHLADIVDAQFKDMEKNLGDMNTSISYVVNNYDTGNQYTFSVTKPPTPPDGAPGAVALKDLDWFNKVGTPVPSDDSLALAYKTGLIYSFNSSIDNYIKDNMINYPSYFYIMAGAAGNTDKQLEKACLEKVIVLTENDIYNKSRLQAQEELKKLQ
jgi:hypothetical protein